MTLTLNNILNAIDEAKSMRGFSCRVHGKLADMFYVTAPNGDEYLVDARLNGCSCKKGQAVGICCHMQYVHEVGATVAQEAIEEAKEYARWDRDAKY
jgi:hypothetical protein